MSAQSIIRRLSGGLIASLLLVGAADANVNKSIRIGDGAQSGGRSTVNGSITVGSDTMVDGTLETVNGSIRIADSTRFTSASTVNGSIRIGSGAITERIASVNGTIRIGANASIDDEVSVVNGKVTIDSGSRVGGDVSNVSGEIRIEGSEIAGNLKTVTGDVSLTAGSTLAGDLVVEKPSGRSWKLGRRKPRIVIGPSSRVLGNIIAEQEIELYISDSATVGGVTGKASLDEAVRFSGDRP